MIKHIFLFGLALLSNFFASNLPLEAKGKKRVFIEQYTSAKCGTCVDGFVMIDAINYVHPDEVISAKLHLSDTMQIEDAEKIYKRLNPNVRPTATIDRNSYNSVDSSLKVTHSSGWYMEVEDALKVPAIANISAKYRISDSNTCRITIIVSFDSLPKMNMAFNYYIIENDVTGGAAFDQDNSFNELKEHAYHNKGNPIKGFVHQNVVRYIGGDIRGVTGTLPPAAEIELGKAYTFSEEIPLKPSWNQNKLAVEALIQYDDSANIRVDNAVYAEKDLSIDENSTTSNTITVFPNPTGEEATARINIPIGESGRLELYNALGDRIPNHELNIFGGETFVPLDFSDINQGAYYLVLEAKSERYKTNIHIIR